MKKIKLLPPGLMLAAGAVTIISSFVFHYSLKEMLIRLLIVLFIFYVLGVIFMKVMESVLKPVQSQVSDDGAVIEKEPNNKTMPEE